MKIFVSAVVVVVASTISFIAGWWLSSPGYDFMCSASSVVTVSKNLSANGIHIPAGIQVELRKCAYMDRFTIQLFSDPKEFQELFSSAEPAKLIGLTSAD